MDWVLLGIPVGIILLYLGSDWMVKGAKGLALRLGVAPFIVGLTVVAFGSSAPEAITSVVSTDSPSIILGNVIGSNIANVGLAIGLAAILSPLGAKYTSMRFEVIMMVVSCLIVMAMASFGYIGLIDGIILVAAIFVFVIITYWLKKDDKESQESYSQDVSDDDKKRSYPVLIALTAIGLVMLYFGAEFFIDGAKELAHMVGMSDMMVGLIVVAIGTSLPELCICLMASYRGENDLAISNIVGSIIFNCFFVLGIGACLVDVPVSDVALWFHIPVMILMAALMFAFIYLRNGISRKTGVFLVAVYMAYIAVMVIDPSMAI